eukprot:983768-Amphidinium_carterae.1
MPMRRTGGLHRCLCQPNPLPRTDQMVNSSVAIAPVSGKMSRPNYVLTRAMADNLQFTLLNNSSHSI